MIIKKSMLNIHREYRGTWPFAVDEIAAVKVGDAYGLVHEYRLVALSGILETHGFMSLEDTGIWADNPEIPGTKKSLSPFFKLLDWQSKGISC